MVQNLGGPNVGCFTCRFKGTKDVHCGGIFKILFLDVISKLRRIVDVLKLSLNIFQDIVCLFAVCLAETFGESPGRYTLYLQSVNIQQKR